MKAKIPEVEETVALGCWVEIPMDVGVDLLDWTIVMKDDWTRGKLTDDWMVDDAIAVWVGMGLVGFVTLAGSMLHMLHVLAQRNRAEDGRRLQMSVVRIKWSQFSSVSVHAIG